MNNCIFCEIVNGKSPAHVIWEDDDYMAFLSIYPNTLGFTVVIPKKHYESYAFELSDDSLSGLIIASKKVAKLLDSTLEDVARTGLIFEGYGVDHVHAKLFPMHGTGNNNRFKKISSCVDKFFYEYEGYISSHDSKRASDKDLNILAKKIREHSGNK
ncbi:HIT family protein [Xenorhabdus eapokensis]|uniref:HIT family protein n=1 Tax=Xenorhabdus eapokensis TaxID=1873482 RepID=A0A1Q5TED7_9GAMM|nr:HIT family protein [Xenorhabdus eapokensis]OKO98589.1 HIT family protein [Xenorhabdus eapokensis]